MLVSGLTNTSRAQSNRVRLIKDQKAPFSGQLLSDEAIAIMISKHEAEIKRLKEDFQLEIKKTNEKTKYSDLITDLKIAAEKDKTKAVENLMNTKVDLFKSKIHELDVKWYQSPYFNFIAGAITFGVLAGSVVYLVR